MWKTIRVATVEVISTDFIDIDVFQVYWTYNTGMIQQNKKHEIPNTTHLQQKHNLDNIKHFLSIRVFLLYWTNEMEKHTKLCNPKPIFYWGWCVLMQSIDIDVFREHIDPWTYRTKYI